MVLNTDGTRPVRFEGLVILFMNSSFPQAACDRVTLGLGFEIKHRGDTRWSTPRFMTEYVLRCTRPVGHIAPDRTGHIPGTTAVTGHENCCCEIHDTYNPHQHRASHPTSRTIPTTATQTIRQMTNTGQIAQMS